jgi:hypothetical protein
VTLRTTKRAVFSADSADHDRATHSFNFEWLQLGHTVQTFRATDVHPADVRILVIDCCTKMNRHLRWRRDRVNRIRPTCYMHEMTTDSLLEPSDLTAVSNRVIIQNRKGRSGNNHRGTGYCCAVPNRFQSCNTFLQFDDFEEFLVDETDPPSAPTLQYRRVALPHLGPEPIVKRGARQRRIA